MNAATVANGVLSFKNRHGGEIHANAVDLNQLFKWYVERANKTTIENLEKLLQQAKQSVV
jgi:hypothetical protein